MNGLSQSAAVFRQQWQLEGGCEINYQFNPNNIHLIHVNNFFSFKVYIALLCCPYLRGAWYARHVSLALHNEIFHCECVFAQWVCDLFTCTRTRHCIAATPSFDSAVAAFRSTWDMYGFDTHRISTHVFNLTPLLRQFSNPFTHLSFLNSLLARGVLWKPVDNGSGYRLHLVSRSIPHHSWVVWLFFESAKVSQRRR